MPRPLHYLPDTVLLHFVLCVTLYFLTIMNCHHTGLYL